MPTPSDLKYVNGIPIPADKLPVDVGIQLSTGPVAFDKLGATAMIAVGGRPSVGGVFQAGSFVGTVTYEQSLDGGSTWGNAIIGNSVTQALGAVVYNTTTELPISFFIGSGVTHVRARVSAYTSGSSRMILYVTNVTSALVLGALASGFVGVAAPFWANIVGGRIQTTGLPTAGAQGATAAIFSDAYGRLSTFRKDTWAIQQQPAVATQATISQAAGAAGVKNVCTSITISISSTAAPTAGSVIFNLRDGATGAGTILWSCRLSIAAVAGNAQAVTISNLWIEGTAATAMTLESSAAPAAGTFATVAMSGTTTQ